MLLSGHRIAIARSGLAAGALTLGTLAGTLAERRTSAVSHARVDPMAIERVATVGRAAVIVVLTEQADLTGAARLVDKSAKGTFVYRQLSTIAERTQPALVGWLAGRGLPATRLLVVNALAVELDAATLRDLALRPDVASIEMARTVVFDATAPTSRMAWEPPRAEPGIAAIGADVVWARGFRGQGSVIAVLDTGVQFEHPALRLRYRAGRRSGAAKLDHNYHWYDPAEHSAEPFDNDGHGTAVAGVAVGSANDRAIGVAPAAEFIACRVSGSQFAPYLCLQWVLAPTRLNGEAPDPERAPDIVNASWVMCCPGRCDLPAFHLAIEHLAAAGILVAAAAGNRGSACFQVCPPSAHPLALSVANFDVAAAGVDPTSSRGPAIVNGVSVTKPDLAAPGTGVYTTAPPKTYAVSGGTSMAAPHVAGAAGLLLSARPDLRGQVVALRQLLLETALPIPADDCGPGDAETPNNVAGHGLLRVDQAVELALRPTPVPSNTPPPTATPVDTPAPTVRPIPTVPGVYVPFGSVH